jgi:hypothetical protein
VAHSICGSGVAGGKGRQGMAMGFLMGIHVVLSMKSY